LPHPVSNPARIEKEHRMRVRRPCLVLLTLLIPVAASADDHFADLYGGVSFAHGSVLIGPQVTFARTVKTPLDKLISVVADFSTQTGSEDDLDQKRLGFMGGVRFTFPPSHHSKHVPFVQTLVGGVNTDDETAVPTEDGTDVAFALGFGYEFVPNRDSRTEEAAWAVRVQAERVFVNSVGDFWRFSSGVVFRLAEK
jgi:hypothetical protein